MLLVLIISVSSFAAERTTVCAKYRKDYGWSKGYQVEATVIRGTELNQKTGTFDYDGFATYVVIFWAEGEASIIRMSFPPLGAIPMEGEDKQGRKWQISKSMMLPVLRQS